MTVFCSPPNASFSFLPSFHFVRLSLQEYQNPHTASHADTLLSPNDDDEDDEEDEAGKAWDGG